MVLLDIANKVNGLDVGTQGPLRAGGRLVHL